MASTAEIELARKFASMWTSPEMANIPLGKDDFIKLCLELHKSFQAEWEQDMRAAWESAIEFATGTDDFPMGDGVPYLDFTQWLTEYKQSKNK